MSFYTYITLPIFLQLLGDEILLLREKLAKDIRTHQEHLSKAVRLSCVIVLSIFAL
jgi:hypothetical protein